MSVKLPPVKICENWTRNGLLDEVIDCSEVNAINVQVTVNGTSPSAVISVEGAATGDYMALPDLNASQTVTADTSFDVVVGTRLARIRIASISGTFPAGTGFTIWVTPYVSPGSARVAASIVVDTLAAIQVLTGALTLSGVCSIGADGGIYQGTGTFASPTTGLKIWRESGQGRIAGYNGGVVQWYADTDGKFYAGGGSVILDATGIIASSGAIGGWVIGATSLMDAAGLVGMSSAVTGADDIRFWAGHATPASAPFRVTEAGVLVATSGAIGGWTINSQALFYDSGADASSSGMMPGDWSFYAGKMFADRATAPFRVSVAGALVATSATITGAITASSGSFTGVLTIGASGEIRQGLGTLGVDFTGLRIWQSGSVGLIAGYNNNIQQWYADTDGKFYAGAGNVILNADGIRLISVNTAVASIPDGSTLIWERATGISTGKIYSYWYSSGGLRRHYLKLEAPYLNDSGTTYPGVIIISAGGASSANALLKLDGNDLSVTIMDDVTIATGLRVGTPTGGDKGTGTINCASDLYRNNEKVAYGGGSTGANTTPNGTVTLVINGASYYLLTAASA